MSLSWADAFKVAVAVVVLQQAVNLLFAGVALSAMNPLVLVAGTIVVGAVVVYASYRAYLDSTPHTRGE